MPSEGSWEGVAVGVDQGQGLWKVCPGGPVFWLHSCPLTPALLPCPPSWLTQAFRTPWPCRPVPGSALRLQPEAPAQLLLRQLRPLNVAVGWPLLDPLQ